MKIGVITFWWSDDNYGQQLQCWALQQYLKEMGHQPFLIKYRREINKQPHAPLPRSVMFAMRLRHLMRILLIVPEIRWRRQYKIEKNRYKELENIQLQKNPLRKFSGFREKQLVVSKEYYSLNDLRLNPPEADCYIAGSDQVWSYDQSVEDMEAYFLQFGNKNVKRIAYAPSVGHDSYPESLIGNIKYYLSAFNAISVREPSLKKVCNSLDYEAIVVCDPTMLLKQADYENLIEEKSDKSHKSIFIYSLNYGSVSDLPWIKIRNYANAHGEEIIVTPGSGYLPCRELFGGVTYSYATIEEWLTNILNSDLVVTASFHGIVLSIILHKKFLYTPLKGRLVASNERILSLLQRCGLEELVSTDDLDMEAFMNREIKWSEVDKAINNFREESQNFLRDALQKGK